MEDDEFRTRAIREGELVVRSTPRAGVPGEYTLDVFAVLFEQHRVNIQLGEALAELQRREDIRRKEERSQ